MPLAIIQFKCDYCKSKYSTMKSAAMHEEVCFYNPETKSCSTCIYSDCDEGGDPCCGVDGKAIFVKKQSIIDCEHWKSKEDVISQNLWKIHAE